MKNIRATAFAVTTVLGAIILTGCGNMTDRQPVRQVEVQSTSASRTQSTETNDLFQTTAAPGNSSKAAAALSSTSEPLHSEIATGSFYDAAGSGAILSIAQENDGSYTCFVSVPFNPETYYSYGFNASPENNTLVYSLGDKSMISYDENGNIIDNQIVDEGHSGTLGYDQNGLLWNDSDGSCFCFTSGSRQ